MKFLLRAAACLIAVMALPVQAEGDAAAGQSKSAVCAACHGPDGNSAVAMWPKLAGQHPAYMERQLGLIKSGARSVPEMAGIVAGMSDQDLADVSAFYASQTLKAGVADESLVALGERIYRAGNADEGVPACMACHGPAGEGNPLSGYPALAGQHSVYTATMLNRYRAGEGYGENDVNSAIMIGVADELTDDDIAALASYIQGLHKAQ